MNITLLTQYYPPEVGAPQARLSEVAKHFVRRGHSVTVLTAMPNYPTGRIFPGYGGLWKRENLNGVNVIRTFIYPTQKADFIRRLGNYFSFVLSSAALGSMLVGKADYLLVESPPLFLGFSGWWLSQMKGSRLIFNVSDLWPESAVKLGVLSRGGMAHQVSEYIEKTCYRKAWLITGQSKSILADIGSRFPTYPTFHLSNGVDTQLFSPDRMTEESRAVLENNKKGKVVALYAGLHGLAQGLDQILEAADVLRKHDDLQITLIGDGPEKNQLMKRASERNLSNVQFLPPRPAREIPPLVAAADILLVTLKLHIPGAVPSKLYEAMAAGRPVVLVADGEAAEIVETYKSGFVVKPGDINGLIKALRLLQKNPDLRYELGQNGRKAVEKYFDRTSIANQFIQHLENNVC